MSENTPPVCNYEGSDYQQKFWDAGGRVYEDAVERVALKRLLPPGGDWMLEIGAGAGRNTPRYKNYHKVALLDYSRTQLEQARYRLGDSQRYLFIAADAYRLPFMPNIFDGATMIRTLHHMADPQQALSQVHQVMKPGGVFILEFANKRNIKSMLRYWFKRQGWNPFDPEPVEFAALNFDFHPKSVRGYLVKAGFKIEKQLTVSHFRTAFLKRTVPTKVLVGLDSVLQSTGRWVQLTPSVFSRCQALKSKQSPVNDGGLFRCPACKSPLPGENANLICKVCDQIWPFKDGIYDFRIKPGEYD